MDPASKKVYILGIGDDGLHGLTDAARRLLEEAEVVFGAEHTLRLVPGLKAEKVAVGKDLDGIVRRISQESAERPMVVLATGDPLFYGVARYLCNTLGKDRFEVVPHVSSMQLAFARVKETWEDAYLTNLGTRPLAEVVERIRTAERVGLFTSAAYPPATVAQELCAQGIDYFTCYVCENLGGPDERVTHAELRDMTHLDFAPLNVMILVRRPGTPDRPQPRGEFRLFGNPDEAFAQSKPKRDLLTPAEVRAIVLAQLDVRPTSVVWDLGAGSGAVAIEAAQLAHAGRVYAVEQDVEDYRLILSNAEKFGVRNVQAIHGRAPDVLADLPDPEAVFLGGIGHEIVRLIEYAHGRLRRGGRLVVNVASVDHLALAQSTLRRLVPEPDVWIVNIARGAHQLEQLRFDAARITFVLAARKS